jgi:hypothetical protein
MHHRLRIYAITVAVVALLVIGVAIQQGVFAQDDSDDSAPPVETTAQTGDGASSPATDASAESAVQYLGFLETVAANLGISDPMAVDTAVKTMLTQVVDEQMSSGAMSDDAATAVRAQIDSGNVAPLIFGQADQGDAQTPTDENAQQDDGSNSQPAPTEAPDDDYDYGY